MISHFDIREADPEDYPLLPDIERSADAIFEKAGITNLPPPAEEAAYASAALVLVSGKPPVGFIRIIELAGQAHLEQLSVHPHYGKQGLGSALLVAAIRELRRRRYDCLTLMTFEDVRWNAPFYRKRGFQTAIDLSPRLQWLYVREKALGMDKLGRRVALYFDLGSVDVREVAEGGAGT
jgi:ribosomal protein S18 acetylase RimI-like enzyme